MSDILNGQQYHLHLGDCIKHMATLPPACMDMSVFSPPFPSLFCYTSESSDIGNSLDLRGETPLHLSFFFRQLVRIMKPGRAVVVHVMQIPGLVRNGERGIFDFRGLVVRLARRAGFTYEYDWLVRKNPQAQAIRTHSAALQFASLERDRARVRGALGDYLIKFVAPGDNVVPVDSTDVTRDDWVKWAEPAWTDIRETDTLNVRGTKGDGDTKHICPLQLEVIERLIKLYSNPGEIVFSPFAGIGSEGKKALQLGRRFYGCELKKEYFDVAMTHLQAV